MEDTKKLTEIRKHIDVTDAKILALLNERAQLALQVRIAKGGTDVYRPDREAQVLEQLVHANKGPLSDEAVERLFKSIIYVCRSIQEVQIDEGA